MSEMSGTISIDMTINESWSTEEPTARLRWKKNVLEQAWKVTTYRGRVAVSDGLKWRSVPSALSDPD